MKIVSILLQLLRLLQLIHQWFHQWCCQADIPVTPVPTEASTTSGPVTSVPTAVSTAPPMVLPTGSLVTPAPTQAYTTAVPGTAVPTTVVPVTAATSVPTPPMPSFFFFINWQGEGDGLTYDLITGYRTWTSGASSIANVPSEYSEDDFKSHRSSGSIAYSIYGFPSLSVNKFSFGFAETQGGSCAVGQRLMDIIANGVQCASNLDVYAAAGDCNTAYILTCDVAADQNGNYVVTLTATVNKPMISTLAIESNAGPPMVLPTGSPVTIAPTQASTSGGPVTAVPTAASTHVSPPSTPALELHLYYVGAEAPEREFIMNLALGETNVVDLTELGYSMAAFNIEGVPTVEGPVSYVGFSSGQEDPLAPYAYCKQHYIACGDLKEGITTTVTATAYASDGTPYGTVTAAVYILLRPQTGLAANFTWQYRAPLPIAMGEASTVSDGTYIYMVTGHGNTWSPVQDLWRYDPSTNSWDKLAPRSVAKNENHVMAQCFNGKIYLIGGFKPETNIVTIYDIATDTWSEGTPLVIDGESFVVGSASSGVVDGKIYIAGGLHDNNVELENNRSFVYDPSYGPGGSWTQISDMPAADARNHAAGIGFNGKFYIFAGRRGSNGNKWGISSSLVYDPATDEWDYVADIPTPRAGMGQAVELFGELYVIGGEQPDILHRTVEAYNPEKNTWTVKPPMQVGRHGHYPAVLNNKIHVVAGGDLFGFDSCDIHEVYAPPE